MSNFISSVHSIQALWKEDLGPMPSYAGGGILPKGGFFLFGGETGIGKSLLMLNIMKAVMGSRPAAWPGQPGIILEDECIRALYLDAEIGKWGLWDRVRHIWKDPPPHGFVYTTDTSELVIDTEPGRKRLLELLRATTPEIVIIDPASSFLSGSDSENSCVADFFRSLRWLQEQMEPAPLTFLISHHFRKKPEDKRDYDPLDIDNFRGASKWTDEAWTALTMHEQDRSKRLIRARWTKVRHGPKPPDDFRFKYDDNHRVVPVQAPGPFQKAKD